MDETRLCIRILVIGTALGLTSLAPAFAVATCSTSSVEGVDILTIAMAPDDTTAIRQTVAGTVEKTDNPPTDLITATWSACGTGIEVVQVYGTDSGAETLRVIEGGSGDGIDFGNLVNFVDLNAGTDTLDLVTIGGASLNLEWGTSADGVTVASQDYGTDFTATDADLRVAETELLKSTGSTAIDRVTASGDMNPTTLDDSDADADPDFTVQGTPGGNADDPDSAAEGGENPTGNLVVPLTFSAGPGDDAFQPGNANDTFDGGPGDDTIEYREAAAAVDVDLEARTATGGSGSDRLIAVQSIGGSAFDDSLLGSSINNRIWGCDGSDLLDGRAGNDLLNGDLENALTFDDTVCGDSAGEQGNDTIYQDSTADGADALDGDGNTAAGDTVDYGDRTTDLYLEQDGGAVSGSGGCAVGIGCEKDIFGDFEFIIGGTGNDTFVGSDVTDETFQGGAGNDTLDGSVEGDDFFDFSDSGASVMIDVPGANAIGNGRDAFDADVAGFIGSEQGDTFSDDITTDSEYQGAGGDDIFDQGIGPSGDQDSFSGGEGFDTLDYSDRSREVEICLGHRGSTCDVNDNGEASEADQVLDDTIETASRPFGGVKVPDLRGMTVSEARSELAALKLLLLPDFIGKGARRGSVFSQTPSAGIFVERGSTVRVSVRLMAPPPEGPDPPTPLSFLHPALILSLVLAAGIIVLLANHGARRAYRRRWMRTHFRTEPHKDLQPKTLVEELQTPVDYPIVFGPHPDTGVQTLEELPDERDRSSPT